MKFNTAEEAIDYLHQVTKQEEWCPQHGYPEPCAKCYGMTQEEWDRFFNSLAEAVSPGIDRGSFAKYVGEG